MQMERQVWTWCCIVGLTIGNVFAQDGALPPKPVPSVPIVRVRTGISCGWCTGNYNDHEATIETGSIVRVNRSSDRKAYPDIETKIQNHETGLGGSAALHRCESTGRLQRSNRLSGLRGRIGRVGRSAVQRRDKEVRCLQPRGGDSADYSFVAETFSHSGEG